MFPLYDFNPHRRFPGLTLAIIAANVAVMVWISSLGPRQAELIDYRYGFVPLRASQLGHQQAVVVQVPDIDRWGNPVPGRQGQVLLSTDPKDVYVTFFTMMFLHGNWVHLLLNMWMLWVFGNNVEDRLGPLMYLCYYLLGGLVGTVCHWAINPMSPTAVIGASGAVAAVLGGYALSYPKAVVRTLVFVGIPLILDLPALLVLGVWFAAQMVAGMHMLRGIVDAPVAFWAHIGGFLAGMVLLPLFALGTSPPESDWRKEADDMFRFDSPRLPDERADGRAQPARPPGDA
jgi:membrane associated rhomboid family serine protease